MTVPPKFKAPEFEKYNGRGDPMIHLQMYCQKMAPYADNEPLLIQTFQDTLTGHAAEWYSQLKKISHWKELADTFLAQYGFNSQIAPDRFDLQRMEKKSNETFREYAQRMEREGSSSMPALRRKRDDQDLHAMKTKKIVDMTALMALAEASRQEGSDKEEGRRCANDRKKQWKTEASSPNLHHASRYNQGRLRFRFLTQVPAPAPTPQMPARPAGNQVNDNRLPRKEPKAIHAVTHASDGAIPHSDREESNLAYRPKTLQWPAKKGFQPKFNLRLPLWRSGTRSGELQPTETSGVNMVEIEEEDDRFDLAGDRILWRLLFHTLKGQGHITPLEAPPGPSTGDACEYLLGGKRAQPRVLRGIQERDHQPDRKGVDDIVEDEMDLDDLLDEGDARGYSMEDDTDEWRNVDFSKLLQFPCLIAPHGFETPEFEIFYENGNPEVHLQKYGEKMALHVENELLMISVFPREPIKTSGHLVLSAKGPYRLGGFGDSLFGAISLQSPFNSRIFGRRGGESQEEEEEEKSKSLPPAKDPDNTTTAKEEEEQVKPPPPSNITITTAEEEHAGPMVEGLSIHAITEEGDSTTPPDPPLPTGRGGQDVDLCAIATVHLKLGPRSTTEQKEALIALLREFHEIFAWSYQDMPGLDTDIVVHKIPVEARMQACQTSTATNEARSHFEDQGGSGKTTEGRFPEHTSPKDNFPLPHIDTLVDNTATNAVFSFMDGFSGYNQIKMAEEDKSKTAFVTHWGTFVYDVMPFGLKNAGATYQRAMVTLFHDMIHHEIEVYVDDMIAKSRTTQDHLTDLRKLFQRLKKYQLRLNPNKCAFGVTSGKLLGFIVSGRGIEIDPPKVQAIRSMPAPKTEKEIRSFLGKINYIARFIHTVHCNLTSPHPIPHSPRSILWAACWDNKTRLGRKEQAIYYLSKKFTEPETRYLLVEKTCCALAWASKKLRQYMLYYTTWLVSRMDPIKYIFEKPALTGKIARWQVLLSEFDILFVARKAIKGQAIADYLADYPSEQLELMDSEFPDEDVMTVDEGDHCRWKLYFDGAANSVGSRIGAVLVSPNGQQTPIAVKLGFRLHQQHDRTNGEWQARDPKLIPYQRYISQLVPKFKYVTFTYTPRAHNHFADALATLASLIKLAEGDDVRPLRNRDSGHSSILEYPPWATENEKKYIRRMAFQFFLSGEILYKQTHDATLLQCAITPKASNGHEFILVAIDYFTKWVEACSFKNVTQVAVTQLCQQFKIQHHNSTPYRPKMNGAGGAANKNVKKILSKMTETYKDWHEHLPYALCAYRTSVRTSVGATPYSLLEEAEWAQTWYEQLNFIDEKRLAALCHGQLYQRRIKRAYNKKARPRTFQPGDLVLKKRNMALSDSRGKFTPSYEGPYVVKKAFSGGAIILADMDSVITPFLPPRFSRCRHAKRDSPNRAGLI
uniref:Integrase catalytic domain-containing protein n=1 Tax=Fagus sylvatica TaxID=28930 RepID=A0A2N9HXX3_FAGSY